MLLQTCCLCETSAVEAGAVTQVVIDRSKERICASLRSGIVEYNLQGLPQKRHHGPIAMCCHVHQERLYGGYIEVSIQVNTKSSFRHGFVFNQLNQFKCGRIDFS